jgi:predicted membrane channel-forming protein YqfA (hemolysin III family)
VNVTKEIGKFYQNKKQWNTGITKNRMLKVWISIWNLLLLQSYTEAKEFEKAVKKRWIWWMFSFAASVLLLFRLAYNQLAQFKRQKKCWKWD